MDANNHLLIACVNGIVAEVEQYIPLADMAKMGHACLSHAARRGDLEIARLLLRHVQPVEADGGVLLEASKGSCVEMVQLLLPYFPTTSFQPIVNIAFKEAIAKMHAVGHKKIVALLAPLVSTDTIDHTMVMCVKTADRYTKNILLPHANLDNVLEMLHGQHISPYAQQVMETLVEENARRQNARLHAEIAPASGHLTKRKM